ncbi:MAG: hypothetical protein ABFS42_05970 [Candidatus Krumholzibacteriota bacterium]
MIRKTSRIGLVLMVCSLALLFTCPALAANKVEGFYEAEVSAQKENGKWLFGPPGGNGMPKHYAELKFWSWPNDKFEVFAKVRAESNREDDRSPAVDYYAPPWFSGEGHIKLRQNKYEAYLFYRQNRFYINDQPLLRLVGDGNLKNDDWGPKAQGVRFDFWETDLGIKNMGGTFIVSDDGGTFNFNESPVPNGADSKIFRLRHKAWDGRIESAAMYLRKDWTDTSQDDIWTDLLSLMHNNVYSFDVAFTPRNLINTGLRLGPINLEQSRWTTEMAWSQRPYHEFIFGESRHRARAIAVEERDIHIGDFTIHSWYNDFGEDFRSYVSNRFEEGGEYNKIQKHAELIWLVPRKSVTTKLIWDSQRQRTLDEEGGGLRPSEEWYGEIYMEFINGFKARFAYKNWHGYDKDSAISDFRTYPDWFGEVSVENFLAKIRLQGRIHDAGTFRQVTIYGFDMNVNLTERLKGYLRAMNVNEETEARHTIFAQLKYDIGWGAEFYFEYGDAGQSDNLVYTDWFVNEGSDSNLTDRFKVLVKAWF